jgi:hypothetical protein
MSISSATPSTPTHIRCPRCLLDKEPSQFKRLASLAQTRNWLKNPNAKTRHTYIGKVCNDCCVKRKPRELTPSEHRKRLINEGKSVEFADMVYADRRAHGRKRLAESAKQSRKKRYEVILEDHTLHLNKLITKTRAKCEYHYRQTNDPNTQLFHTVIEGVLTQVRRQLRDMGVEGRSIPKEWRLLIPPSRLHAVREAYANVRGELQDRIAFVVLAITGDRKIS